MAKANPSEQGQFLLKSAHRQEQKLNLRVDLAFPLKKRPVSSRKHKIIQQKVHLPLHKTHRKEVATDFK